MFALAGVQRLFAQDSQCVTELLDTKDNELHAEHDRQSEDRQIRPRQRDDAERDPGDAEQRISNPPVAAPYDSLEDLDCACDDERGNHTKDQYRDRQGRDGEYQDAADNPRNPGTPRQRTVGLGAAGVRGDECVHEHAARDQNHERTQ